MWQVRPDYSPQSRQVRRSSRPRSPEQRPVRTALNSRSQPSSQELTLSFQALAGSKPKTCPARLLLSIRKDAARSPGSARQGVPGRAGPLRSSRVHLRPVTLCGARFSVPGRPLGRGFSPRSGRHAPERPRQLRHRTAVGWSRSYFKYQDSGHSSGRQITSRLRATHVRGAVFASA